jgi:hypothetical protein
MRMAVHDLVLKDFAPYSVPRTTNENHENISVWIASLWAQFLDPRPCKYEVEVVTT